MPWNDGDLLGAHLVHADGAGQHARTRIGDIHHLQQALDGAVLAIFAVQSQKRHLHAFAAQLFGDIAVDVDADRVIAQRLQRRQAAGAGPQGDLPLTRKARP